MKRISKGLLGIAVLLGAVAAAQAQVTIINDDLNANTVGNVTAGYTFGDVANATHTYQPVGVGGSVGALVSSDFIPPGVGYGGVAYQYQVGNTGGINTSPNMADYTLEFDALVNKTGGGFGLIFQAWSGAGFSGTFSSSSYPSELYPATANAFQHFVFNLGTFNPGADPTGLTWQFAWQMDEFTYGGPGTGNQMVIDNIKVTMVPEPASLALCGVGALALVLRRRKA